MSGPALRQLNAHRSIHEAAYGQVKDMTDVLKRLYQEGRNEEGKQAEEILIEHWRDHIISHADSEEEGLYQDFKKKYPEMSETIAQLTRDHDLLRKILAQIEADLEKEDKTKDRLAMYDSLLIVNWHHSRDEERYLLGE
ncbi:hemerythrin domain-containing protein [Thalassobacillus pellis]|uniref:hemerythrin domain-containing protein n=1 Tax=Thalassobacillus pellis TaxID=748008 RepID=UPI0019618A1C|nr:hemerythrin domain-containing protein [Thalassobacillus pellis]MBM7551962.1 hemerythrin-like domain-containing protein [Thalassobacillus pellis]